ncbi:hypothetical protein M427DRAFT_51720 [Gonapodya prolifera JEL478]|uniref:Xylanolytic transcriptional activator regulatory domain-containing protein n=1 Tax=Gonapodya prolifera (strain JEL478) TaxID=1344416 RepID=A0A139AVM0_GONPJ|nr:hypothetical protein M427DRAFT_51720 [Gonapodya prolifera JEL478]|eukprot:KXS20749.1 hypothetical protein M427DRAFT_51720 [Gonapodya prolifera JEL478]
MPKAQPSARARPRTGLGRQRPQLGRGDRMTDRIARLEALLGAKIGGDTHVSEPERAPPRPSTPPTISEGLNILASIALSPGSAALTQERCPHKKNRGRAITDVEHHIDAWNARQNRHEPIQIDPWNTIQKLCDPLSRDPTSMLESTPSATASFFQCPESLESTPSSVTSFFQRPESLESSSSSATSVFQSPESRGPWLSIQNTDAFPPLPLTGDSDDDLIIDIITDMSYLGDVLRPETSLHGSNPGRFELSLFDDLPPLPPTAECNQLFDLYFSNFGEALPFIHKGRFTRSGQSRHMALSLSMLAVATRYHPSPTLRNHYRSILGTRLRRLYPQIIAVPSLYNIQTLVHHGIYQLDELDIEGMRNTMCATLAGFEVVVQESGAATSTSTSDREAWLAKEERRRTAWIMGHMDRLYSSAHGGTPKLTYEDLAMVQLPCHEVFWTDQNQESSVIPPSTPTLELFYDRASWPLDALTPPKPTISHSTTKYTPKLGCYALNSTMLHCLGTIVEFRLHCAKRRIFFSEKCVANPSNPCSESIPTAILRARSLHKEVCDSLDTWFARFCVVLGTKPAAGAAETSVEPMQQSMAESPRALLLFIHYHCLFSFFFSPVAPAPEYGEESNTKIKGPPAFLVAWMMSAGFVKAVDHASAALNALALFRRVWGFDIIAEFATPWWCYALGMTTVSLLVAMREIKRLNEGNHVPLANQAEALRVVEEFLSQIKTHISTVIAAFKVAGRIWKPAGAALRLVERLMDALDHPQHNPSTKLLDLVTEKQHCVILHLASIVAKTTRAPAPLTFSNESDFIRVLDTALDNVEDET